MLKAWLVKGNNSIAVSGMAVGDAVDAGAIVGVGGEVVGIGGNAVGGGLVACIVRDGDTGGRPQLASRRANAKMVEICIFVIVQPPFSIL
jgi:hypothetical protein